MELINRAGPGDVAFETTLLLHGVPRGQGERLARELAETVRQHGVGPAFVGVYHGRPTVGLDFNELNELLMEEGVEKANTSNVGILIQRGRHGATTVSTTMEFAAAASVRIFATGGIGGVHRGYGTRLDISADLAAFARFPVAVVTSGVKSLLDVVSTREMLETLGVPVVGFGTDSFPAFYLRESEARVDARIDDVGELAAFIGAELDRTGRGIVIANPVPAGDAIPLEEWDRWLAAAESRAATEQRTGRNLTPTILRHLHEVSGGATLRSNLALVRSNADLAARLCRAMQRN
jgi:pseudouridylate synthase